MDLQSPLRNSQQLLTILWDPGIHFVSPQPTRTIIIFTTMTGLRIGEILALRWGRINLLRRTLLVAETCYKGHFGTPKPRTIFPKCSQVGW